APYVDAERIPARRARVPEVGLRRRLAAAPEPGEGVVTPGTTTPHLEDGTLGGRRRATQVARPPDATEIGVACAARLARRPPAARANAIAAGVSSAYVHAARPVDGAGVRVVAACAVRRGGLAIGRAAVAVVRVAVVAALAWVTYAVAADVEQSRIVGEAEDAETRSKPG